MRAINDHAEKAGPREVRIQAVYEASDQDFQAEVADYRQSVALIAPVPDSLA